MEVQPKFQKVIKIVAIISLVLSPVLLVLRFVPIISYLAWACIGLPWILSGVGLIFAIIDAVRAKAKKGLALPIVAMCVEVLMGIVYAVIYVVIILIAGGIAAMSSYYS